jgi:phage replication-related protein YjqB (UPF0714/DUF867 family)
MFDELLSHPGVRETVELGSSFGLMAFHGGLEGGTEVIAEMVAGRSGASVYVVVQPPDLTWHIPSAQVSPAHSHGLATFLDHVEVAVAIHGYGRPNRSLDLLLGGTNRTLAAHLADALRRHLSEFRVIDDVVDIPIELRGLHPDNPVNKPRMGGVQLELPPSVRGASPSRRDRGRPCLPLPGVIDALAEAASTWPAGVR